MRSRFIPRLAAAAVALVALVCVPSTPTWSAAAAPVVGSRLADPGVVVDVPAGIAPPPEVSAASYLVADADSGEVLAARDAHAPRRPASTLKVLTALALFDRLDPAGVYTAVFEDADVEGSKVGIVPGSFYTIDQLWQALFMSSANDAANALAHAAGGLPFTVARMNDVAGQLQANDTVAVNPTGLDADGQVTTAYDLVLIGRAALRVSGIMAYAQARAGTFPGSVTTDGTPRGSFQISTKQAFLRNYEGAIGLKNGYTSLARHTYLAAASRGGRTIVVATLQGETPGATDAAALSDWAFAAAAAVRPVGELVAPLSDQRVAPPSPTPAAAAEKRPAAPTPPRDPVRAEARPRDVAMAEAESGRTHAEMALPALAVAVLAVAAFVVLARAAAVAKRSMHRRR